MIRKQKCIILIFIFFILNKISYEQSYWVKTNSPTNVKLKNCFFINTNTGWISGDSGRIYKTTNNGNNWDLSPSGINKTIESMFFINERLGWATGLEMKPDSTSYSGTIILKTTNGGNSWTRSMYVDTNVFLVTISFPDSSNGYMGGAYRTIVYTTNAGSSWVKAYTDSSVSGIFPVFKIKFLNSQTGFASGGFFDLGSVLWKTTNAGRDWDGEIVGSEPIKDLVILNSNNVIGVGGDFEFGASIVKTTNAGMNWNYNFLGYFGIGESIDYRTSYEAWISLGFAGNFLYTLNSGNNWTLTSTPDSLPIYDIQFIDSTNGWAVGDEGVVLRYNYSTSSINTNSLNLIEKNFILHQNYPNPFNPVTKIKFDIRQDVRRKAPASRSGQDVKLIIYDALGKEVRTLVNQNLEQGSYEVEFDGINLPSGIYFYELKVGNYFKVKRMLLLK